MHAAHQKGVVHRDLKPANVLLAEGDMPKVTDFGLAKRLGEAGRTATGAVMGTPSYMAPEQAGGKGKDVGPPADVYSLGAILYECLTGRPPFRAATALDTLLQVVGDEPAPVRQLNPQVPRDLETVCLKCLAKEPPKRYASAAALAEDLRRFRAGEPVAARPVGRAERLAKWTRRKPAVAALLLVGGVAAAAVVGAALALAYNAALQAHNDQLQTAFQAADLARQEAEEAGQGEAAQRAKAEAAREHADQHLYVRRVHLAERERSASRFGRANQILDECPVSRRHWEWHYLKGLCNAELHSLAAKEGETHLPSAICPAHLRVALASRRDRYWAEQDGKQVPSCILRVLEPSTGKEVMSFRRPGSVETMAFSPDGRLLATGGRDGPVLTLDTTTGKELSRWLAPAQSSWLTWHSLVFSPDGKHLAALTTEDQPQGLTVIHLLEVTTGRVTRTFRDPDPSVFCQMAFSPDGQRLALAGRRVKLWDVATGQVLLEKPDVGGRIAFSRDGKHACSTFGADEDGLGVVLWETATGKELRKLAADRNCLYVAFGPSLTQIALATVDPVAGGTQGVRVEVVNGLSGSRGDLGGHDATVVSLAYSADGSRLLSSDAAGAVKVWAATDDRSGPSEGYVGADWVRRQADQFYPVRPPRRESDREVTDRTEDGRLIASATSKALLVRGKPTRPGDPWPKLLDISAGGPFGDVALDPRGKYVAAVVRGEQDQVVLWDMESKKELYRLQSPVRVEFLSISPDGRRLAARGNEVVVWEVGAERQPLRLRPPTPVWSLGFSPDGRRLAAGCGRPNEVFGSVGEVRIWEMTTGEEVLTLHGGRVWQQVTWSRDGRRIASVRDGEACVWDAKPGPERRPAVQEPRMPPTGPAHR
jgi:WD40 repeat protein